MKKTRTGKLLALASSMAVAVSSMGITASAVDEFIDMGELFQEETAVTGGMEPSHLTPIVEVSKYGLKTVKYRLEDGTIVDPLQNVTNAYHAAGTYPAAYSLVDAGKITSVKSQESSGTCWAHTAVACAESSMIMQGLATKDINYSERHLAYFAQGSKVKNSSDPLYGDGYGIGVGKNGAYDAGGNIYDVSGTWGSWQGAELDSNVPFTGDCVSNAAVDESYRYHSYAHLENMDVISISNRNAVKEAIMKKGALYTSYYSTSMKDDGFDGYTYNKGKTAFYQNKTTKTNHAVTIVGWDDNFDKSNFKACGTPEGNGAWLIKNSWGADWGDNGYFWMSYYEKSMTYAASFTMDTVNNYGSIYQYDGVMLNAVGYSDYKTIGANVFTAADNSPITAVSCGIMDISGTDAAIPYTIKIYTGVNGTPDSGTLAHSQTGTFSYEGFHTIDLTKAVSVTKGQKFSVIFELGKANILFGHDNHALGKGQSFLSAVGQSGWYDTANYKSTYEYVSNITVDGVNIAVKAYTKGTGSSAPAKPTGVTVTPGDKSLTVKWNPVAGATKYYIYTYLNGKYTTVRTNYTGTSYTITGLTNGTKYGVLVRAFNDANLGSAFTTNDLVVGTPVAAGPAKPTGVTVTPGDKTLTVKWNPVAGATKYYIYTYLNGQYTLVRANYTNTAYAITGLTNGVKYGVLVRAFNDANVGSAFTTNDLVVGTPVAAGPAKPTGVTVTPGDKTLTVKWNPVAGATKYYIYTYLNGQYTLVRANYTNTAYAITGLTNGVKYGVLVRAFNDANVGSAFTTNDLVTGTPTAPAATTVAKPTGISLTPGDKTITVKWDAVKGATKYYIYTYLNGKYTLVRSNYTNTAYAITGLTNGTSYGVLVRAFNDANVGSAFTTDDLYYAVPSTNKMTAVSGNAYATLKWNAVSGATSYQLTCSYSNVNGIYGGGNNTVTATFPSSSTSYEIANLTNDQVYSATAALAARINNQWVLVWRGNLTFNPTASAGGVAKPSFIYLTPGNRSITVNWHAVSGATKYYIYTYLNGKYTLVRSNYVGTSYTITGLTNGTRYGVLVRSFTDENVGSAFSSTSDIYYATPSITASSGLEEDELAGAEESEETIPGTDLYEEGLPEDAETFGYIDYNDVRV